MSSLLGALGSLMPSQQNTPGSVDELINLVAHTEGTDHVVKQLLPILKQLPTQFFTQGSGDHKDPLDTLNPRRHSLAYAFFLDARCRAERPEVPRLLHKVLEFLEDFDRQQIQLAPEKFQHVAQGLARLANLYGNSVITIKPLANAIKRYAPSPNHLTNLHQIFVKECILSKCYRQALPILDNNITEIDIQSTGITYTDHLLYHYYGGMIYIGLKNYERALYFFQLAISAPSAATSAIQIESYKKYVLVSLLLNGKIFPLPKYTAVAVFRSVKNHCQAYQDFATAFESLNVKRVRNELQKCSDTFKKDKNLGLAKQTLDAIYRQKIQQLTQTYLTLSLTDIAETVGLEGSNAPKIAEEYVLRMIESREIFATISHSHQNGMVCFHDNPDRFNTSLTVSKLEEQIAQAAAVTQHVIKTDHLVGCSKEYLSKQHLGLSGGGIPGGLGPADEGDFLGSGAYEPFIDEGRFFG